jgi:cell wall assembly regulator SMI1
MTVETMIKRIAPILSQIRTICEETDRLEEELPRSEPFPPASEKEIAAAEKRLGVQFPPSYRAFLRLHNGWKQFQGDNWIIGVSGRGHREPAAQQKRDLAMFAKSFKRQGRNYEAELKEREKSDPEVIHLPSHPAIGTNFNGGYLVLDMNRPGKGGEYPVAKVVYGDSVERRFPDFLSVIQYTLKEAKEALVDAGGNPSRIAKSAKSTGKGSADGAKARAKRGGEKATRTAKKKPSRRKTGAGAKSSSKKKAKKKSARRTGK